MLLRVDTPGLGEESTLVGDENGGLLVSNRRIFFSDDFTVTHPAPHTNANCPIDVTKWDATLPDDEDDTILAVMNAAESRLELTVGGEANGELVLLSKATFSVPTRVRVTYQADDMRAAAVQNFKIELVSVDQAGEPDEEQILKASWNTIASSGRSLITVTNQGFSKQVGWINSSLCDATLTPGNTAGVVELQLKENEVVAGCSYVQGETGDALENGWLRYGLSLPDPMRRYKLRLTFLTPSTQTNALRIYNVSVEDFSALNTQVMGMRDPETFLSVSAVQANGYRLRFLNWEPNISEGIPEYFTATDNTLTTVQAHAPGSLIMLRDVVLILPANLTKTVAGLVTLTVKDGNTTLFSVPFYVPDTAPAGAFGAQVLRIPLGGGWPLDAKGGLKFALDGTVSPGVRVGFLYDYITDPNP